LVFSRPGIIPTVLSFVTDTIIILPNESFIKTDLKLKNTLGESILNYSRGLFQYLCIALTAVTAILVCINTEQTYCCQWTVCDYCCVKETYFS
jgi:hypothetical protein